MKREGNMGRWFPDHLVPDKKNHLATTTSIDDIYLGDAPYDPWLGEMNLRGITLFVHPVPSCSKLMIVANPSRKTG
jgi:hypothetical protein